MAIIDATTNAPTLNIPSRFSQQHTYTCKILTINLQIGLFHEGHGIENGHDLQEILPERGMKLHDYKINCVPMTLKW